MKPINLNTEELFKITPLEGFEKFYKGVIHALNISVVDKYKIVSGFLEDEIKYGQGGDRGRGNRWSINGEITFDTGNLWTTSSAATLGMPRFDTTAGAALTANISTEDAIVNISDLSIGDAKITSSPDNGITFNPKLNSDQINFETNAEGYIRLNNSWYKQV